MPTTYFEARAMVARQRVQACLFAHTAATVPEQKKAVEEDIARLLGDALADVGEAQVAAVRQVFVESRLQVPAGQTPKKTAQSCSQIKESLSKAPQLAELYQAAAGHLALAPPPPAAAAPAAALPASPPAAASPRSFEIPLPSASECFGVTQKHIFVAMPLGVQTVCAMTGASLVTTALPFTPTRVAAGGGTVVFFDPTTYDLATMRLGPSGLRPSTLAVGKCFTNARHLSCWGGTVALAGGPNVHVFHFNSGRLSHQFKIFAHKKGVHKLAVGESEILTVTESGDHMRFWSTRSPPQHVPWCADHGEREKRMSVSSIAAHGREFFARSDLGVWKIPETGPNSRYAEGRPVSTRKSAIAVSDNAVLVATEKQVRRWDRHNLTEASTVTNIPAGLVEELRCISGGFVTRAANKLTLRVHRF